MKHWVGVDPGKRGGVAIMNGKGRIVEVHRMPETLRRISNLFLRINQEYGLVPIVLEKSQPMPKQGVRSVFTYGQHYGNLEALVIAYGLPLYEVRPTTWKRLIFRDQGDKDKSAAIRMVENNWPEANLVPGQCKRPQDGMAEAVLLCEYGRRSNL